MTALALASLLPAEEVEELIESNDLTALRSVDDIDGVPIDASTLLETTGASLDRRLQTLSDLASSGSFGSDASADIGEAARRVLEQSKFEVGGEGILDRLGALLIAWFNQFLDWLTGALGGPTNAALIVAGLVVAVGITAFTFLARRRSATLDRRLSFERLVAEGGDPTRFEGFAAEAASRGAFDEAVRYRFLAGLLRLDLSGRITFRPGLTTWEISERLGDQRFDHLMDTFNDVAYGGRHADAETYADAVNTWHDVLDTSRSSV